MTNYRLNLKVYPSEDKNCWLTLPFQCLYIILKELKVHCSSSYQWNKIVFKNDNNIV